MEISHFFQKLSSSQVHLCHNCVTHVTIVTSQIHPNYVISMKNVLSEKSFSFHRNKSYEMDFFFPNDALRSATI